MKPTKEQLWRMKHHAPELYEILRELMERFNGGVRFPLQSTCDKANEALAKVEGE